jgi:RimJ/RimL family protein N-acetyltransferase
VRNPLNAVRRSFSWGRYHVLALERPADLVDVVPPQGVTVRLVADDEVSRVGDFRDASVVEVFHLAAAAGDTSVYAWRDGRVVGHFSSMRMPRGVRTIAWSRPGDALLAWGNVRPDLRGQGIFQAMICALTRELFRDGVRRVVSDVPRNQPASLAAHRKCGFRVIGEGEHVRAFRVIVRNRYIPAP